ALEYIMQKTGMTIEKAVDMLNHKSGMLGVSGVSSDMRDLLASKNKHAWLARKIFVNRVVRYVGAYAAELDGIDGIVCTAGRGEHGRGRSVGVMSLLRYVGVEHKDKANATDGEKFNSKPDSIVKSMNVPTNEESMIAREVVRLAE